MTVNRTYEGGLALLPYLPKGAIVVLTLEENLK